MSLPVGSAEALENAISDALGGGGSWNTAEELRFGEKAVALKGGDRRNERGRKRKVHPQKMGF